MRSPWGPIAFVAGVTAASTMAFAQPIVSPSEVADPAPPAAAPAAAPAAPIERAAPAEKAAPAEAAPAKADRPAASKAAAPKASKAAASTKASKSGQSGKSSKSAKATRKQKKVAKSTHSAKAPSSSKPSRSKHPSTKSKPSAKPAAPAPQGAAAMPSPSPMRAALASSRAARGHTDNMPRGFTWPATPAMQAAGKACEAELSALGVSWKPAAPEGRMVDAVEVPDGMLGGVLYTSKWRSPPHKLDCQLARALARIGPELRAAGVHEVRWGSIYRWSNVRTGGQTLPFLSRHALGLAMDIVEFVDDAGRVANVQHDYLTGDSLLAGVEQAVNDSGKFRLVLTPKNDPKSHHDHFHVEANPDYAAP